MTGSAEREKGTPGRLAELLIDASTEAVDAAGGHSGGVYLRSSTPGLLRLAVLAGLPGPLFRPWGRLHADSKFPVADAYRLGVHVVLPNATETMRRYPQFAASLPFQFGSLYVPVIGRSTTYGVLTVLRPSASDATEVLCGLDRMTRLAEELGGALADLEDEHKDEDGPYVAWDGEAVCVQAAATYRPERRMARFAWDPATALVTGDRSLHALLGVEPAEFPGTAQALADVVAPGDAYQVMAALRATAAGKPPPLPLRVRTADGSVRLLDLWTPATGPLPPDGGYPVSGVVIEPGPASEGDSAADLLPDGVFCLDRLGLVTYANPRAAQLLGRPREELLGRPLWEGVPWLNQIGCEDQLRGALLSLGPVHFHVRRPDEPEQEQREGRSEGRAQESYASDWLAMAVHPGRDGLTCTVAPSTRVAGPPLPLVPVHADGDGGPANGVTSLAPLYRPIVLAIALTEAVTARQVSAVVMKELLPAFGGRRLAIYLLQERHLYLAWETGFPQGFLAPFDGVGLDTRLPGVETLTTGRPLFFDSMQQLADAYPGIPLDAEVGARAFLPLIASGRPVGSAILGFDRSRSFSTEERAVLTALAGLIAHAMEKAQRYDSEAALARGLQQALLPRRLSAHPQVETAGRYLPGTQGMEVGGDWYDVVEAGDGLALVIGDVQGHGVQAAATMGQLRSAVRAFALGDRPPDEVMSGTNHLLIDLDPASSRAAATSGSTRRAGWSGSPGPGIRRR
jgi:PAS domain-containing protein